MWTPSLVSSPGVAPESSTATHDVAGVAKSPATTVPLLLGPPAKGTSKPKLMPAPPKGPPPAAMMKQASSTTETAVEKQTSGRESSEMHPVEKEASGDDRRDDRDHGGTAAATYRSHAYVLRACWAAIACAAAVRSGQEDGDRSAGRP